MAKQDVSPVQVQMAAAAGVKLLQIAELPVPMSIAKTGALSILEGMLQALASGELVLGPPQPQNIAGGAAKSPIAPVETPPQGDQDQNGEEGKGANETERKPRVEG